MKTVAVDFDGVIHAYSRGWQDGSIYDEPVPGAVDGLRQLMEQYAVHPHDPRCRSGHAVAGAARLRRHDGRALWVVPRRGISPRVPRLRGMGPVDVLERARAATRHEPEASGRGLHRSPRHAIHVVGAVARGSARVRAEMTAGNGLSPGR